MISGFFKDDLPWLLGWLFLPRLGKETVAHFVVDTGSERTLIHPWDAKRLVDFGLDFRGHERLTVKGIGGMQEVWVEQARITFSEETIIEHPVLIAVPTDYNETYPSLLGRDLLHTYRMLYSFPSQELTLSLP